MGNVPCITVKTELEKAAPQPLTESELLDRTRKNPLAVRMAIYELLEDGTIHRDDFGCCALIAPTEDRWGLHTWQ